MNTGDEVMYDGEAQAETTVGSPIARQYSARSATRPRSSRSVKRVVFFALASSWGFIVGVVGLIAAIGVEGQHIVADSAVFVAMIPALLFAVLGGLVMAAAYKESKRRSR
jgi:hypothetical protein